MTQTVEHLVDALLAMKDAHAAKYHDETWTEQDAAAQEHAARAIAEYGADRERKVGGGAERSMASGPRIDNRLANALHRMLDSAKELASEAGDVDEWNEGGHAYEACQDARRTLAEFRAQSAPRDAKAPELLEVAKQALRFLEDSALTGGDLAPALQAAIARAGGQEAGEISRIPAYDRANPDGMRQWFEQMSQRGLLFHPEDSAETIIAPDGSKLFTDVESAQADAILKDMFDQHGNRVIDVCYPIFMGAGRVEDEPDPALEEEHEGMTP